MENVHDEIERLQVISGHRRKLTPRNTLPSKEPKARKSRDTPASIPPHLLDIKQAAEYLSSTPWAVRTLIWSGELPYVRLGKKHLIARADLDKVIDQKKEAAGDAFYSAEEAKREAKSNRPRTVRSRRRPQDSKDAAG